MEAPELLTWRGFPGPPPGRLCATSGRALSLLARSLGNATVVTVPLGLDADVYVLLAIAGAVSIKAATDVATALQAHGGSVTEALRIVDEAHGSRPLVVDRLDRLAPSTAGGDLVDVLEPRRRDLARWLEDHATVSLVEPQRYVSHLRVPVGPANITGWDTTALWKVVEEDPERFALAIAVRTWLGADLGDQPPDARSLVLDLWQALPAEMRDLLALLVVHGRPAPRSLLLQAGLFNEDVVARAIEGWLVDQVGSDLRLSPSWYLHAPVPAAARASLHRRLATSFAAIASSGGTEHAPFATLEAHRHYVAVPDIPRAREFARFGAAYLLDHARQQSEKAKYGEAASEYDAVLRLDDAAREAGSGAVGGHARAYAMHYRHFNRARVDAEPMTATLAGYEGALLLWPENALFWSRVIRCKFLLGQWVEAARALHDAYERVPIHPKRDSVLVIRTAERLLEREEILPAFIVATERTLSGTPLSLEQLWRRLGKGEPVARVWVPGGRELRLVEPHVLQVVRKDGEAQATWFGTSATADSAREAVRQLVSVVEVQALHAVEAVDAAAAEKGVARALDLGWAARADDDDARWIAALQRLEERVGQRKMPALQRDAVVRAWTTLSSRTLGLRRPAVGPAADDSYFLSWAYDDIPQRLVTVEVATDGRYE